MLGHVPQTRTHRPVGPLDLRTTLSSLRRGPYDPTLRWAQDGTVWRVSRTADGPATVHLRPEQGRCAPVHATAWGPGADAALAGLDRLLGGEDDAESFDPRDHLVVTTALRQRPGLRMTRTDDLLGALVPAVLEQRVLAVDAFAAWSRLLHRHGGTPPGPAPEGMRVPPDAAGWRDVPVWDWRRAGVEDARTAAVRRAVCVAGPLQAAVDAGDAALTTRRLLLVPGIGPWTAAEVTRRALGDADAVSVGDLHLPRLVEQVVGRRVEQHEVLAALSAWAPHRGRLVRLLELVDRYRRRSPRPRRAVHVSRRSG